MKLTFEQVKNLNILADFMERLQTSHFNMNCISYDCDTPACAFGWACTIPHFQKEGLSLRQAADESWAHAGRLFGTPTETVEDCEHGPYSQLFHHRLYNTIKTPQQWAAHCRAFLKANGYLVKDDFPRFMQRVLSPVDTKELQGETK